MNLRAHIAIAAAFLHLGCEGWQILDSKPKFDEGQPYRITLLSQESCPLPEHLDPKNVALLSYRVRLESNHESNVPANYFYATLLTTEGRRYLSTFYGCEPRLSHEPLRPGESVEGFLNFSVPPSKVPEKLVYAPELMNLSSAEALTELSLHDSAAPEEAPSGPAELSP